MPGGALQIQGLSRHYGRVRAVDDLTLDIPAGAFVTLLGPSGCGKSTTLNLIAGLDRPTGGRILVDGRDVTGAPPNDRRIAMVFQNYALYPHMTAFDNIAFGLRLGNMSQAAVKDRVSAVAMALSISNLLDRLPGQMSGGQQQRVALARALAKDPELFLLDEPFSNLDATLRARLRTEVKHLHLELGTTSVFVTHDQEEAMILSDFIAVMRDGRVVQFGGQREIYDKPNSAYVATFVGKPRMSLLDGRIEVREDRVNFAGEGIELSLPSPRALGLSGTSEQRVQLGLRAEDVLLTTATSATSGSSFVATIALLEPIGSDTFVELTLGGIAVVARASPDLDLTVGQTVSANVNVDRVHLFDSVSGARLNA